MKFSSFVYKYDLDKYICLYHSLLMKKFFLSKDEYKTLEDCINKKIDNQFMRELYDEGFIIKNNKEDEILYKEARNILSDWELETLFLVVTDKCNFKCKYCFENLEKYSTKNKMNKYTAFKAIETFIEETKNSQSTKTIFFYGGETLLAWEIVRDSIKFANQIIKNKKINTDYKFDVITNGSLINEEVINFAKKYKVSFGVSLDGLKCHHDKMRIYSNGKGTFDRVVNGINLLRKNRIEYSILCTVGPHNIDELDKICGFFIKELGCNNINLTLPLAKIGEGYPYDKKIPIEYLVKKVIEASKIIRKEGAYEGTYFKHLISFVEEELFRGECDGMGKQVVVSPDGRIGPCIAFINDKRFFKRWDYSSYDIKNKKIFRDFAEGIALMMPKCKNCPALGICGGGCIFNRYVKTGKISEPDKYFCSFMRKLLEHFIKELYFELKLK